MMKDIPTCTHIKDDGSPCSAIPVKGTPYCYFHRKYHNPPALPGDKNYVAPLLESHHAIELALTQLYQAFLAKKIDMKEAQFGLQVLRLASKTIAAVEKADREAAGAKKTNNAAEPEREAWSHERGEFMKELKQVLGKEAASAEVAPGKPVEASGSGEAGRRVWDPYGCMPK